MPWWPWLHRNLRADPNVSSSFSRTRALFNRPAATLRPLTAVIDAGLRDRAPRDRRVDYLLELAAVAPISAHLYAADGPPASARRLIAALTEVEAVEGWVTVSPGEREGRPAVAYLMDGVPTSRAALADDPSFLRLAEAPQPGSSPEQVKADAMALLVAKTMRADLLITDRQLLAEPESSFWWTTTVMTPEDALPLLGLYLRQQGKFVYARTPALGQPHPGRDETVHRPPGWFYWQAASTLIPGASGRGTSVLPITLLQRVDQALRSRDRLLAAESVPQSPETVDDIQNELDQTLLWLMAAFDIVARIAHETFGLSGRPRDAGWQRADWLKQVEAPAPELAALMKTDSSEHQIFTIVRLMRNSIHGEALSAMGFIVGPRPLETLVGLPDDSCEEVGAAMDALGGRAAWGAAAPDSDTPDHLRVALHPGARGPAAAFRFQPGEFVEQLVPRAIKLLDELMAAVPISGPVEANQSPGRRSRPVPLRSLFDERILWQLGL